MYRPRPVGAAEHVPATHAHARDRQDRRHGPGKCNSAFHRHSR
ncbi:hypothetical protein XA26_51170 [Mycolicibacterium fortuitum]|uniref:Uncharacterized protein n=1 Tax=Mycolicibacterium fortuitum TaxID=1766 RepID=A0A0N7H9F9_MYCFO|nr:hypothetical protein XA26_51170 [Mycolicibacterium fortuitum]